MEDPPPEVQCPACPLCDQPPFVVIDEAQAFCGTDTCQVVSWDRFSPLDDLLTDVKFLKLAEDRAEDPDG